MWVMARITVAKRWEAIALVYNGTWILSRFVLRYQRHFLGGLNGGVSLDFYGYLRCSS